MAKAELSAISARAVKRFPILETTAFKTLAVGAVLAWMQGDAAAVQPGTLEFSALRCLDLAGASAQQAGAWDALCVHATHLTEALQGHDQPAAVALA